MKTLISSESRWCSGNISACQGRTRSSHNSTSPGFDSRSGYFFLSAARPLPVSVQVQTSSRRMPPSLGGLLLGTAIGDALGQPLEGHDLSTILRVDWPANPDLFAWRFVGADKGSWGCFRAGETSDDTQLTLALRDALAEVDLATDSLDAFMERVSAHHLVAYHRSTKGWGPGTVQASRELQAAVNRRDARPWQSSGGLRTAGNGALMKLLPLVLAHVSMRVRFAAAERA